MKIRFPIIRLPFRGVAWLVAMKPFGGFVLILTPRFHIQFLRMGDTFDPPHWVKWRVK